LKIQQKKTLGHIISSIHYYGESHSQEITVTESRNKQKEDEDTKDKNT